VIASSLTTAMTRSSGTTRSSEVGAVGRDADAPPGAGRAADGACGALAPDGAVAGRVAEGAGGAPGSDSCADAVEINRAASGTASTQGQCNEVGKAFMANLRNR
jgi:hypothetical protein